MGIKSSFGAPEQGLEMLERALHDLLPLSDDTSGGRRLTHTEEFTVSQPVAVYRLLLSTLLERRGLEGAEQVGWRYVVESEYGSLSFVDLAGVDKEQLRFGRHSQNLHSSQFVRALHVAQDAANDAAELCEIRSLDVPALQVAAVWVTSHPPAIVPYIAPSGLRTELLLPDYDFVGKLYRAAQDA